MRKHTVIIISISQLFNYLLPIVTFPFLINTFSVREYGIWVEVNTIVAIVMLFGTQGIANALSALVVNSDQDKNILYANALYLVVIVGAVLSLLVYGGAPLLDHITTRDADGLLVLRLLSILIFTYSLNWLSIQVFRLRNRPVSGASFDIALSSARLAAVVLAATHHDLIAFSTLYVILQVAISLVQIVFAYGGLRLFQPSIPIIRKLGRDGINLSIVSQASTMVMFGDRLMLSILSSSSAVAVYSASYQLTLVLTALGWPYLYALLPALGETWKQQNIPAAQQLVRQTTRSMMIVMIPSVVGLAAVGNSLLKLLASDDFAQGGLLIGVIAVGVALEVLGTSMQYIFYAQGRPEVLRQVYTRAAVLNVLANLIAIPLLSYYGTALTTLLTFIYVFYSLWRRTEMPFRALFDLGIFQRCLLISAVMGVWVIVTAAPTIASLAVAIIGSLFIYGIGLLALRVVSLDEILAIPRAIYQRLSAQR